MALYRLLAVARSRSARTGGALLLGALLAAAAARADERVYVWRDGNGDVRFSAVQQPPPAEAQPPADTARDGTAGGQAPPGR